MCGIAGTAHLAPEILFWSRGGCSRKDKNLATAQNSPSEMPFEKEGRFYAGRMRTPADGSLILNLVSPRPLRIWLDGVLALDEGLCWRRFERQVRAAVVVPCVQGETALLVEVGARPGWPEFVEKDCPSRNREKVRAALQRIHPDRLQMQGKVIPGVRAPAVSLCFLPAQFHREGVTWQHVLVRPLSGFTDLPPSLEWQSPAEEPEVPLSLSSSVLPGHAREDASCEERKRGYRRFHVPVANPQDMPASLRQTGATEERVEPSIEVARMIALTVAGTEGGVTLDMPAFESLGRHAPHREFRRLHWPAYAESKSLLPEPILPSHLSWLRDLYDYTWKMLWQLFREPTAESGVPNAYLATASRGFFDEQFVWDSSFSAMCTAYAWRTLPAYATLDLLYSRQFDGGYIHREHDLRSGLPMAFEPDFSPNPPIMSVAEWSLAALTGDRSRIAQVYPLLKAMHQWLATNRKLPDGTYWTTGLANGLDNSPSLGEGYPCLTAQMAHDAEILGKMAHVLDRREEATAWEAEYADLKRALNEKLWSDSMGIYSTSLAGGGHNPNKIVTAFWPLWAGAAPPERVESLARHLKDPKSFWRHHPIPSLAADSPHFVPGGNYWVGSTWPPTNYAAIKGFDRSGRHDLAYETAMRHLQCMSEVFNATGHIWENYCSEKSARGSWSGPDYCWSALGPVAMLLEIIIGLQPDALNQVLRWNPPDVDEIGIRNLALGLATVEVLSARKSDGIRQVEVKTNRPLTLEVAHAGKWIKKICGPGHTTFPLTMKTGNRP